MGNLYKTKQTFKLLLLLLLLSLLQSYKCYNPNSTTGLSVFNEIEGYDAELIKCLKGVESLCSKNKTDYNEIKLDKLRRAALDKAKKTKKFHQVYCTNFKDGKVNIDFDRKCKKEDVQNSLKSITDCNDLISKDHDDYEIIHTYCDEMVTKELSKKLTPEIKENYQGLFKKIMNGFKEIYKDNDEVLNLLNKIKITHNYEFRLTQLNSGVRSPSDFYQCSYDSDRPKWCDADKIIVPGGRIFSDPENIEVVMAHEIGHLINDKFLPENDFGKKMDKLRGCNHLHSKYIDNETVVSEASADIHMAKYIQKFMQGSKKAKTHFCHYQMHEHHYLMSNYLHAIHRQSLINCADHYK